MSDMPLNSLSPYGRFLHHCARGELAYQRTSDGNALFFPRQVDPTAVGKTPKWAISAGIGRVYAVTMVCHRNEPPFALVLVDLEEGFRMMSRVDTENPEDVAIGARVSVEFRQLGEDQPALPVFTLMDGAP